MGQEVANYSYFPILVEDQYSLTRDELYQCLQNSNIYARRYFYPLISNFPMYNARPSARASNLQVANSIADKVICLPIYPALSADGLIYVINVINKGHKIELS